MESSSDPTAAQESITPDQELQQEQKRRKKRDKVRSAWISFVGRILAQILGAVAMITLGLALADRMNGDRAGLAAVLGDIDSIAYVPPPSRVPADPRPSAVVLPLDTFSRDVGQQLLADSLTDELIEAMSRIPEIRTVSRTSAMQFRHEPRFVPQIATELQVDFVVEGSFKRDGDRVHISARVIDARRDSRVGAVTPRVSPVHASRLRQSELASSIAREVAAIIMAAPPVH